MVIGKHFGILISPHVHMYVCVYINKYTCRYVCVCIFVIVTFCKYKLTYLITREFISNYVVTSAVWSQNSLWLYFRAVGFRFLIACFVINFMLTANLR